MSNPQEEVSPSSLTPKWPYQQSRQPLSHKMRLSPLPGEPPISSRITEQPEQPLSHQNNSSRHEVDNRSFLSVLATVKYEAIKPRQTLERKNIAIPYPATVNRERSRKAGFLVKLTSFFRDTSVA